MTYIAAHALNLALLLLLFHATGLLVVRAAGGGRGVAWRTGLLPIALGICAWCYWLMALAFAGLFTRWMLIGSAIAVSIGALGLTLARRRTSSAALPEPFDSPLILSLSKDERLAQDRLVDQPPRFALRPVAFHALAWLAPGLLLANDVVLAKRPSPTSTSASRFFSSWR